MSAYVDRLMADVEAKNPGELEFHQAVREVATSIELLLDRLKQVARAGLLELEIAGAGDAEESDLLDPTSRIERAEIGGDDLLDGYQVTAVRQIIEGLGLEIATPDEARDMLALKGPDTVAF